MQKNTQTTKYNPDLDFVLDSTVGHHGFWLVNHKEYIKDYLEDKINKLGARKVVTELEQTEPYSEIFLDVYELIYDNTRYKDNHISKVILKRKKANK